MTQTVATLVTHSQSTGGIENDPDCGYTGDTQPIYRWYPLPITTDYICDECPAVQYRWENISITEDYVCVGTDKYYKQKRQYSYDSGTTWYDVTPPETQTGSLYQTGSTDCGYVPSYSGEFLTFVAIEDGKFKFNNDSIKYSLDGGEWHTLASNTWSPQVNAGHKIRWYATLTPYTDTGIGTFASTAKFNAEGNVMSMLYGLGFANKTSLNDKSDAFVDLFSSCTGLTSAENLVLPATTLSYRCYKKMFQNCTSLTTAPELPATTLPNYCYEYMFDGCSSLNNIKCLATEYNYYACSNWVRGVASAGIFVKNDSMTGWSIGVNGIPSGWTVQDTTQHRTTSGTPYCQGYDKYVDIYSQVSYDGGSTWSTTATTPTLIEANSQDCGFVPPVPASGSYLTFEAIDSGTFKLSGSSVSYSLDSGSTWSTLSSNSNSPTVSAGSKIMWKGNLTPTSSGIGRFSSTGRFNVEGNVMSLLYGDDFADKTDLTGKDYAFKGLFYGCTGMTSAENLSLPATTLASSCYTNMFRGCTSLTSAPSLPATALSDSCYGAMFYGCELLTTASELPATTLTEWCYAYMFLGCASLNYIKCLATDISANSCTLDWVSGVASSGTFIKAASASWARGTSSIPSGWTVVEI